jgi:cytidylate kinase
MFFIQRFAALYGLDYRHKQHYDIRIDTSPNTAADTRRQALDALRPFQHALGLSGNGVQL